MTRQVLHWGPTEEPEPHQGPNARRHAFPQRCAQRPGGGRARLAGMAPMRAAVGAKLIKTHTPSSQMSRIPFLKKKSFIIPINRRPETIKLKENMDSMPFDIDFNRLFLDMSSQARETKANINKWDLIKIKSFCTTKETIIEVKRQPSEWEKIIANEVTDKKTNLKTIQATPAAQFQKINDPIKKWAKELNRHFSKEDIQMATNT